jgi:hypothetical protein
VVVLMVWLLASGALMVPIKDNDDHMDGDGDKCIKF